MGECGEAKGHTVSGFCVVKTVSTVIPRYYQTGPSSWDHQNESAFADECGKAGGHTVGGFCVVKTDAFSESKDHYAAMKQMQSFGCKLCTGKKHYQVGRASAINIPLDTQSSSACR